MCYDARMKLLALILVMLTGLAHADGKADRSALADALTKLSASATNLGKAAKAADDRGARKKFAPAAIEVGDDLAALARRIGKDVPLKTVSGDAAEAEKAAAKLVEVPDAAVRGDAAPVLALRVGGPEPERLQNGKARIFDALMVVRDREVPDVVHLPRGHAAPTGLDPSARHDR